MKTKNLYILLLFVLMSSFSYLSAQKKSFDVEGFKQKKAEFIIKETGMTDAEAKAFIPLSNELMDKKFEINRESRTQARALRKKENKTEADYATLIDEMADAKIKEAQLNKEYLQKFKKILSAQKIYKYQQAEAEFMKQMVDNRSNRKNK